MIVQQHDRRQMHRLLATPASGVLAPQILYKPIGKVIFRAWTPSRLGTARAAIGTRIFDVVIERVAIKRGPAGVSDSNRFQ